MAIYLLSHPVHKSLTGVVLVAPILFCQSVGVVVRKVCVVCLFAYFFYQLQTCCRIASHARAVCLWNINSIFVWGVVWIMIPSQLHIWPDHMYYWNSIKVLFSHNTWSKIPNQGMFLCFLFDTTNGTNLYDLFWHGGSSTRTRIIMQFSVD